MNNPDLMGHETEEKPLDPATLRIQAKLKKLLLGSSLIMLVGFIAVFAAIFYKINSSRDKVSGEDIARSIILPAGVDVEQVHMSEGRLIFLVRDGQKTSLLYFDAKSGEMLGQTSVLQQ